MELTNERAKHFFAGSGTTRGELREKWLAEVCRGNVALRARIQALLQSHAQGDSFLDHAPPGFEATLNHQSQNDLPVTHHAEPTATLKSDSFILKGNAGNSILESLCNTIDLPRVVLREPDSEGSDPIVRSKSPEMPKGNSDSRYQVQGEIARGGMGAVLKGRDTDLGRDLAIKVLLAEHKDRPEVIQRFIEEAQIAANCSIRVLRRFTNSGSSPTSGPSLP